MTGQTHRAPFWEALGLPAPGTRMTVEQFQQLPEVNFFMELIDGIVVYPHWDEETMTPAPVPDHQRFVGRIYRILSGYADDHNGEAHISPLDIYLSDRVLVQPDVIWLAADSRCVETDKHFRGPPELCVEVLSPSTGRRDKTKKFDLYEKHGIQEYWMVDPRDKLIEVYGRDGTTLARLGAFGPADVFQSPVLGGAKINTADIFRISS